MLAVWIYMWAGLTTAFAMWQFLQIDEAMSGLLGGDRFSSDRIAVMLVLSGLFWWAILPAWVAVHCSERRP